MVLSLAQGFAAAQFLQHVVHARQREVRVQGLLRFAVRVELLCQLADALGQLGREVGVLGREGERLEAGGLAVNRSVFK